MIPKEKTADDAVSPVIGVMLMVVITVIIAAVISVFATGIMGDDSGRTSMVMLDVGEIKVKEEYGIGLLESVEFIHRGGDSLSMHDIEITAMGNLQHILSYFPGDNEPEEDKPTNGIVTVNGAESNPSTIAEAGDSIKIRFIGGVGSNAAIYSGETVTWTVYDKRTEGILASGDFVVP